MANFKNLPQHLTSNGGIYKGAGPGVEESGQYQKNLATGVKNPFNAFTAADASPAAGSLDFSGGSLAPAPALTGGGFGGSGAASGAGSVTPSVNASTHPYDLQSAQTQAQNALSGMYNASASTTNTGFDALKTGLGNNLKSLGTNKDNLLSQVGENFKNLINGITQTGQTNINKLNQQKQGLDTQYTQGFQKVRNSLTDAIKMNRQLAGSMGNLDSSYYQGLQNDSTQNAQQQVGNMTQEQISNDNNINTGVTEVGTKMNNDIVSINGQETTQKNSILASYTDKVNQINSDITLNEKDRQNALQSITAQRNAQMSQITQNFLNYKAQMLVAQNSGAVTPNYDLSLPQTAAPSTTDSLNTLNSLDSYSPATTSLNGAGSNIFQMPTQAPQQQSQMAGYLNTANQQPSLYDLTQQYQLS